MARANAAPRARRLLALLPHLNRGESIPLDALAAAVGASRAQVASDLTALSMCGLPPFTPDQLLDVQVDGDLVRVWSEPPALTRKVRLSPDEARALAAALEACGRGEKDPLAEKLLAAASTGTDLEELARVVRTSALPGGAAEIYSVVASAIEEAAELNITYFSAGRGETTERVVRPLALINERGAWYLDAECLSVGERRTFRLDRIEKAARTGSGFVRDELPPAPYAFEASGLPLATIVFESGDPADEREFPGAGFERLPDGRLKALVPYAGTGWIARKVLARLGKAVVEGPEEVRRTVADLARQAL